MAKDEDKGKTVPLGVVIAIVAALGGGGASYGVNLATAGSGVKADEARHIAREEIKAANVADKTDVAVIAEKVAQLEKSSQTQVEQLKKITDILLEMRK